MNAEKTAKRVVRIFMAWNDEKEQRWLEEQARSGWLVRSVNAFGYTFERAAPAEVAYRLDWTRHCRRKSDEYLGLFRDAGWEHLGRRGNWNLWRKPVADGVVPEIYTDPASRIAMYRQVAAFLFLFFALMPTQMAPQIARWDSSSAHGRFPVVLAIYGVLMAFFLYDIIRILLVISRLKKSLPRPS